MILANETILKAISWTLLHSVWQGFLVAVLAGLVILLTKKSASAVRYNLLSALFVVFIAIVGFTFNYEQQLQQKTGNGAITGITGDTDPGHFLVAANENQAGAFQAISEYLNAHADMIVLVWFLVFSLKCFGIFRNMNHIYRIRKQGTKPVSEFWKRRLSVLCERISLKKRIVLMESALVRIPSVTGIFKPMILVPAGLLASLPHDQIEAILLHELAHIRRRDYFINIIQSLAEIVFFFNPGILWLSSLLKTERENCCDDIAIAASQSKSHFLHALVSFQEFNLGSNALMMAFPGKGNHLLSRAQRIVSNNNRSLSGIEKVLLIGGLAVIGAVMLTFYNYDHQQKTIAELNSQKAQMQSDKSDALAREAKSNAQAPTQFRMDQAGKKKTDAAKTAANTDKTGRQALKSVTSETYTSTTATCSAVNNQVVSQVTARTGITAEKLPEYPDTMTESIISEMLARNIIQSRENLSFTLSGKKMTVNGTGLCENTLKMFRDKYLGSRNITIYYNYDIAGSVTVATK